MNHGSETLLFLSPDALFSAQALKQRDEELAREIELLHGRLSEIEKLAKGRGLGGIFAFRHGSSTEDTKPTSGSGKPSAAEPSPS